MPWTPTRAFVGGILATLLIMPILALAVIASGIPNMAALPAPGIVEATVGTWALGASRARRASTGSNPLVDTPAVLRAGLEHYRTNCLPCHGAPDLPAAEFADGLHPGAPHLTAPSIAGLSDGQLHWTITNGIKMTGMPGFGRTHSEQEIWSIVLAMRHLDHLTPEDTAVLHAAPASDQHHQHPNGDAAGHEHEPGLEHEHAGHEQAPER